MSRKNFSLNPEEKNIEKIVFRKIHITAKKLTKELQDEINYLFFDLAQNIVLKFEED